MAALLIAPVNGDNYAKPLRKMIEGNYHLGWLIEYPDGAVYTTWGMSKNKECALKAAEDCFRKHGKKELLIYDKPVNQVLTLEEVKIIREYQTKVRI